MSIVAVRPANTDDEEVVRVLHSCLGYSPAAVNLDPVRDFVAQVNGEVIGWIQVTFGEELPEIKERGAWIQSVAVLPQSRRDGVGEQLVQRAEAQALKAGDRFVACQPIDRDSEQFFERLGYADNTPQGHEPFWSKGLA